MMFVWIVGAVVVAFTAASVAASDKGTGGNMGPGNAPPPPPGTGVDPSSYNLNAWAADLSEIKDPAEYGRVAQLLQVAGSNPQSAVASIRALQAMASQLDSEGYHNAAKRCRIRAADIAAYYHLPG